MRVWLLSLDFARKDFDFFAAIYGSERFSQPPDENRFFLASAREFLALTLDCYFQALSESCSQNLHVYLLVLGVKIRPSPTSQWSRVA